MIYRIFRGSTNLPANHPSTPVGGAAARGVERFCTAAVRLRAATRNELESGLPTGQTCLPLHRKFRECDENVKVFFMDHVSLDRTRSTNCSTSRRRRQCRIARASQGPPRQTTFPRQWVELQLDCRAVPYCGGSSRLTTSWKAAHPQVCHRIENCASPTKMKKRVHHGPCLTRPHVKHRHRSWGDRWERKLRFERCDEEGKDIQHPWRAQQGWKRVKSQWEVRKQWSITTDLLSTCPSPHVLCSLEQRLVDCNGMTLLDKWRRQTRDLLHAHDVISLPADLWPYLQLWTRTCQASWIVDMRQRFHVKGSRSMYFESIFGAMFALAFSAYSSNASVSKVFVL